MSNSNSPKNLARTWCWWCWAQWEILIRQKKCWWCWAQCQILIRQKTWLAPDADGVERNAHLQWVVVLRIEWWSLAMPFKVRVMLSTTDLFFTPVISVAAPPDLGSPILNPYFWELGDNILGTKYGTIILCRLAQKFFRYLFKKKEFSVLRNLWLQKKVRKQIYFPPPPLLLLFDPGSKIRYPG